jgi:hypothetical protein
LRPQTKGFHQLPTPINAAGIGAYSVLSGSLICAVAKGMGFKVRSVSYVNRSQVGAKYRGVELRLNR